MKVLFLSLIITTNVFAYHSSTAGNQPVKEEWSAPEKRDPASEVKPAHKPEWKAEQKPTEVKK